MSNIGFHGAPRKIHKLPVKCHRSVVNFERSLLNVIFEFTFFVCAHMVSFISTRCFSKFIPSPAAGGSRLKLIHFHPGYVRSFLSPPPRRSLVLVRSMSSIATSDLAYEHITSPSSNIVTPSELKNSKCFELYPSGFSIWRRRRSVLFVQRRFHTQSCSFWTAVSSVAIARGSLKCCSRDDVK